MFAGILSGLLAAFLPACDFISHFFDVYFDTEGHVTRTGTHFKPVAGS